MLLLRMHVFSLLTDTNLLFREALPMNELPSASPEKLLRTAAAWCCNLHAYTAAAEVDG